MTYTPKAIARLLPDAAREEAIRDAETSLLYAALEVAKTDGNAHAAADIAFELGRRIVEGDKWENDAP